MTNPPADHEAARPSAAALGNPRLHQFPHERSRQRMIRLKADRPFARIPHGRRRSRRARSFRRFVTEAADPGARTGAEPRPPAREAAGEDDRDVSCRGALDLRWSLDTAPAGRFAGAPRPDGVAVPRDPAACETPPDAARLSALAFARARSSAFFARIAAMRSWIGISSLWAGFCA